jgi:hypothetical protein
MGLPVKGFALVEILDDRQATLATGRSLVLLWTDHFLSKEGLKRS